MYINKILRLLIIFTLLSGACLSNIAHAGGMMGKPAQPYESFEEDIETGPLSTDDSQSDPAVEAVEKEASPSYSIDSIIADYNAIRENHPAPAEDESEDELRKKLSLTSETDRQTIGFNINQLRKLICEHSRDSDFAPITAALAKLKKNVKKKNEISYLPRTPEPGHIYSAAVPICLVIGGAALVFSTLPYAIFNSGEFRYSCPDNGDYIGTHACIFPNGTLVPQPCSPPAESVHSQQGYCLTDDSTVSLTDATWISQCDAHTANKIIYSLVAIPFVGAAVCAGAACVHGVIHSIKHVTNIKSATRKLLQAQEHFELTFDDQGLQLFPHLKKILENAVGFNSVTA